MSSNRLRSLTAATLIALACFTTGAIAGSRSRTHTRTTHSTELRDDPSSMPGKRLDIELRTGGGLRIEGRDGNVVTVQYVKDDVTCPDAQIDVDHDERGVSVKSHYDREGGSHNCSIQLVIRVPKHYDVHIESAGGGMLISDIDGTIDGHTGGGEMDLERLAGTVTLATGGGGIHVRDSRVSGRVSTGGGEVVLENVSRELEASSGSGPVRRRGSVRTL